MNQHQGFVCACEIATENILKAIPDMHPGDGKALLLGAGAAAKFFLGSHTVQGVKNDPVAHALVGDLMRFMAHAYHNDMQGALNVLTERGESGLLNDQPKDTTDE